MDSVTLERRSEIMRRVRATPSQTLLINEGLS